MLQLEKEKIGKVEIVEINIFQDIGRAILFELKKLLLMLAVSFFLLLFNFIPVVGTIVATAGGLALLFLKLEISTTMVTTTSS